MQIEIRCVFRNATLPKMIWDGVRSEIDPTITSIASILIITVSMVMIASGIMEYKAENKRSIAGFIYHIRIISDKFRDFH